MGGLDTSNLKLSPSEDLSPSSFMISTIQMKIFPLLLLLFITLLLFLHENYECYFTFKTSIILTDLSRQKEVILANDMLCILIFQKSPLMLSTLQQTTAIDHTTTIEKPIAMGYNERLSDGLNHHYIAIENDRRSNFLYNKIIIFWFSGGPKTATV